ncbi:hypothetical protein ABK040_010761 [Willaertia magna]
MCWSMTSSFCFAILGLIMTIDQTRWLISIKVNKERQFSQVLFYLTYTLMESLQFFQYYFGLINTCNTTSNLILSFVAHFLIWIQPPIHNYWCLKNTLKGRTLFKFTLMVSFIVLITMTVSLLFGFYNLFNFPKFNENLIYKNNNEIYNNYFLYQNNTNFNFNNTIVNTVSINGIEIQNLSPTLCSSQGPNHLYWMFPYHRLWGYTPHWFAWIMTGILPHFFRKHSKDDFFGKNYIMALNVAAGWLIALIYCGFNGILHETPSYWCLISVPFLVNPYLVAFIRPNRFNCDDSLFLKKVK